MRRLPPRGRQPPSGTRSYECALDRPSCPLSPPGLETTAGSGARSSRCSAPQRQQLAPVPALSLAPRGGGVDEPRGGSCIFSGRRKLTAMKGRIAIRASCVVPHRPGVASASFKNARLLSYRRLHSLGASVLVNQNPVASRVASVLCNPGRQPTNFNEHVGPPESHDCCSPAPLGPFLVDNGSARPSLGLIPAPFERTSSLCFVSPGQ